MINAIAALRREPKWLYKICAWQTIVHKNDIVNAAIGACSIKMSHTLWPLNGLIILEWLYLDAQS